MRHVELILGCHQMQCDEIREWLGAYLDGEVGEEMHRAVESHLPVCGDCSRELAAIRRLHEGIDEAKAVVVPSALWNQIEARLDLSSRRNFGRWLHLRPALAVAACLLFMVAGAYVLLTTNGGAGTAQAATVNFSALLDDVHFDPHGAFNRFIALYHGRAVDVSDAKRHAHELNFDLPQTLPGGFELQYAYAMRIGDNNAAAGEYSRRGELLGVIFHPPVHPEQYGTHQDYACVVGEHRGHAVAVGEWRLVHLTDATTCHCVLSRLDESTELPPILKAVAPELKSTGSHHHP